MFCSKGKINFFKIILCAVFPKLTEILTLFKVQKSPCKLQNGQCGPEILGIKIMWFTS